MRREGLSAGLFLVAWGIFAAGTAPSIYGGDVGELVASAATLGISHAPGYPLHALIGKAFSQIVPWGGPAYRVNLSSAFFSALTVAGLFILLRGALGRGWALAAAGLYALFPIVWDQAQTAEVFALNNLFAVTLLLLWRPAVSGNRRWLVLWAFVYGMALANHQTIVLLAPGFLIAFLRARGGFRAAAGLGLRTAIVCGAFGLLGMSLYFYLPFRAARHPPINFGDPHTPARFFDVLSRKEFGSLELHPTALPFRTPKTVWQQTRAFVRQNAELTGGTVFVLGAAGLFLFARGGAVPPFGPGLFVSWFLSGLFFYLFSNLSPFNTLALWRLERFLLLPALFIAAGAAALLSRLTQPGWRWAAPLMLALSLGEWATAGHHPWFRWTMAFRDFGRNLAASLPPGSLLVIDRVLFDEPTSTLLNRRLVEKKRPDLRVIYRPGTLFELFYGEDVLEIPRGERLARQAEREKILWADSRRPLSVLAFARENLPPFDFSLRGLVYRREPGPDPSDFYIVRPSAERPVSGGDATYPTRLILAHYPYFRAKAAFEADAPERAAAAARRAARDGSDMEWLRSNLGSLWSRWGAGKERTTAERALTEARREFEKTVALDFYFAPGHFGLGYARLQEGRPVAAAESFSTAVHLRPDWPEAYYMLGVSHSSAGFPEKAERAWERFLALDPASPLAAQVRSLIGRAR